MAYDWTFQGRSEMVRCSLDTLAICSIMPKVQLSFCEKIKLYDETNVGVHILLSAAEGEIVQVSIVQYRVTQKVSDLGWVDLELGSSPGRWAGTMVTYCHSNRFLANL